MTAPFDVRGLDGRPLPLRMAVFAPQIAVGVAYGLRTFRIREDGHLLPASWLFADFDAVPSVWDRGHCVARCKWRSEHEAPVTMCTCGVSSWDTLARLQEEFPEHTDYIVGVVRLEGRTVQGVYGDPLGAFRSEAARIVALWVNDSRVPVRFQRAIRRTYPDIKLHYDRTRMIAQHMSAAAAHGKPPTLGPLRTGRGWPFGTEARPQWVLLLLSFLVSALTIVLLLTVVRNDVARWAAAVLMFLWMVLPLAPVLLGKERESLRDRIRLHMHPVLVPAPIRRVS